MYCIYLKRFYMYLYDQLIWVWADESESHSDTEMFLFTLESTDCSDLSRIVHFSEILWGSGFLKRCAWTTVEWKQHDQLLLDLFISGNFCWMLITWSLVARLIHGWGHWFWLIIWIIWMKLITRVFVADCHINIQC